MEKSDLLIGRQLVQHQICWMDRFQGHMFDIKDQSNTTVAGHFASHQDRTDPRITIHILGYIKTLKDAPSSKQDWSGFTE